MSPHERSEFLAQWVSLNPRFTLRNLTERVGFDRPINDMAVVESLLLVECRLGDYVPIQESFLNLQGHLVHYVRVLKTREIGRTSLLRNQWDRELNKVNISLQLNTLHYVSSRERKWLKILEGSTVDRIARMLCEPSRY